MTFSRTFDGARTGRFATAALSLFAAFAFLAPVSATAQQAYDQGRANVPSTSAGDRVIRSVAFDQKLDTQVPTDLEFRDETGATVHLRDYMGQKPVIVTLVYYQCPMLCTQVLNGLVHTMIESKLTAGTDFEVVTVSIDPREGPDLAAKKKQEYLTRYNRPGAENGWHFLVGDQPQIERLADAVGYRYMWDDSTQQFAHPSGIVVLTPMGRISHYFYGIQYPQADVRLGLVEASENKIGNPVDKLLLLCYHYDPQTGRYGIAIMNVIRALGVVTFTAIVGLIFFMLRREKRKPVGTGEPTVSV